MQYADYGGERRNVLAAYYDGSFYVMGAPSEKGMSAVAVTPGNGNQFAFDFNESPGRDTAVFLLEQGEEKTLYWNNWTGAGAQSRSFTSICFKTPQGQYLTSVEADGGRKLVARDGDAHRPERESRGERRRAHR